jgi:hypothetical protein
MISPALKSALVYHEGCRVGCVIYTARHRSSASRIRIVIFGIVYKAYAYRLYTSYLNPISVPNSSTQSFNFTRVESSQVGSRDIVSQLKACQRSKAYNTFLVRLPLLPPFHRDGWHCSRPNPRQSGGREPRDL